MFRSLSALALLLAAAPTLRAADESGQWLVVTAPAFRKAVEPLCEHRKAQGLRVVVVVTSDVLSAREIRAGDADKLRDHVRKLCKDYKGPRYVLLVGAVEAGDLADPEQKVTPTLPGTAGRMKGQPSDNGYGRLDDGLLPAVAVGRFPARTVDEAKAMVRKTLDYERDDQPGTWRRRLTVLAGIPAYNAFVDRLVEGLAMARFDKLHPRWTGRAIYSNATSRFCVPEARLREQATTYVQEGQAFICYFGHSWAGGLYGGEAAYLERDDFARLKIARGRGVLATFGCNGCQLKGKDGEGYGVAAMRNPDGPTAVLGSHGICFAAMVQLAADGLVDSTFTDRVPGRLAESWLALKKGLAEGKIDDLTFGLLDAVDGDSTIPQATQRREHLEMFVLLGDPALKLPMMAEKLNVGVDGKAAPGATLTVHGGAPMLLEGARVKLTLERPVTSVPAGLEPLPKAAGKERDRVMLANHDRANRFVLAEAEAVVKNGLFEAKLVLPKSKLPSAKLWLRAYAATERWEDQAVLPVEAAPEK